jgi:hypothetical protein
MTRPTAANRTNVSVYRHEILDCDVTEFNLPEWSFRTSSTGRTGLEVYAKKQAAMVALTVTAGCRSSWSSPALGTAKTRS